MALITTVVATTIVIFPDPILSDQLISLGISSNVVGKALSFKISIGYIFAISCFAYSAASSFIGLF